MVIRYSEMWRSATIPRGINSLSPVSLIPTPMLGITTGGWKLCNEERLGLGRMGKVWQVESTTSILHYHITLTH